MLRSAASASRPVVARVAASGSGPVGSANTADHMAPAEGTAAGGSPRVYFPPLESVSEYSTLSAPIIVREDAAALAQAEGDGRSL